MTSSPTASAPASTMESLGIDIGEATLALAATSQEVMIGTVEQALSLRSELNAATTGFGIAAINGSADLALAGVDIALACGRIATHSSVGAWREAAAINRTILDGGLAAFLRLIEARSTDELVTVQTDYLRSHMDKALAGSARMCELMSRIAEVALAPSGDPAANTVTPFARAKAA